MPSVSNINFLGIRYASFATQYARISYLSDRSDTCAKSNRHTARSADVCFIYPPNVAMSPYVCGSRDLRMVDGYVCTYLKLSCSVFQILATIKDGLGHLSHIKMDLMISLHDKKVVCLCHSVWCAIYIHSQRETFSPRELYIGIEFII